jgi:hypothetical protein
MSISSKDIQRFARYFFYSSIAIISIYYVKWFLIDPFIYPGGRDSTSNFRGSMFLLIVYGCLFVFSQITRKVIFYVFSFILLLVNFNYLNVRMPYLEIAFRCNGATYYIVSTYWDVFFDAELTKWQGGLNYETHYFPNKPVVKIVCDEQKAEINFIGSDDMLIHSEGKASRSFYYTTAQLDDNRFFLSEGYSCEKTCTISSYTLYQCKSDFTACNPLPISYKVTYEKDAGADYELKSDEVANTVSLFESLPVNVDKKLIFTFGEDMLCYAEGCVIDDK